MTLMNDLSPTRRSGSALSLLQPIVSEGPGTMYWHMRDDTEGGIEPCVSTTG
jgi:hypothetical protein